MPYNNKGYLVDINIHNGNTLGIQCPFFTYEEVRMLRYGRYLYLITRTKLVLLCY